MGRTGIVVAGVTASLLGACAEHHAPDPVDDSGRDRTDAGSVRPWDAGRGALDVGPPDTGEPDAPSPDDAVLWFEAEEGIVEAPMIVQPDPLASGAAFVMLDPGALPSRAEPPPTGRVTISFETVRAGEYRVWGRVIALHDSADSFWVRMDGGPFYSWNNIGPFPSWQWDDVHDSNAGFLDPVVTFDLAPGEHALEIAYREPDAQLDRLAITDDLSFVPDG